MPGAARRGNDDGVLTAGRNAAHASARTVGAGRESSALRRRFERPGGRGDRAGPSVVPGARHRRPLVSRLSAIRRAGTSAGLRLSPSSQ
jgi:hypothetical protein